MRVLMIAALAALTVPALADGFGGSNQLSTTTSQTTTTKTQDGDTTTTTTTTRSETSSSGGGFNLGGIFGNGGGHSPSAVPTYESLGGSWTIGETNGSKTCTLTLEKTKFISNYGARTGIGCPEGLFGVSSWLLAGDEIRLQSPAGFLLAKLHPAGHGRWNGTTTAGLDIFMTRN